MFFLWIFITQALAITLYRLFMHFMPLPPGYIEERSREEFIYHVHLLFFLIFFQPIMRSNILPVPMMTLFYKLLGAKIGKGTYPAGLVFDPLFITLGQDVTMGHGSGVVPHQIEGKLLSHEPIEVGDYATLGGYAIIFQGVKIGKNAIVAAGAVVAKGSVIPDNEIWGGAPARRIGYVKPEWRRGEENSALVET